MRIYYTHAGRFYASEVFGFTICRMAGITNELVRTDPELIPFDTQDIISDSGGVFDISSDHFDNNKVRLKRGNGLPYSTAGLIWKKYGYAVALQNSSPDNAEQIAEWVDKQLIQHIDVFNADPQSRAEVKSNGVSFAPTLVPTLVESLNSDENAMDNVKQQIEFLEASAFVEKCIIITIRRAAQRLSDAIKYNVQSIAYDEGTIIVMDSRIDWENILRDYNPYALFYIQPSDHPDSKYNLYVTPYARRVNMMVYATNTFNGYLHPQNIIAGGKTKKELIDVARHSIQVYKQNNFANNRLLYPLK